MERLTRSETYSHIKYTIGHTRWIFDKRDHSRLQEAFDELYDYQSIGSVEEFRTIKSELDTAKTAICDTCRTRGKEQHILCACVSCKYGGRLP